MMVDAIECFGLIQIDQRGFIVDFSTHNKKLDNWLQKLRQDFGQNA